MEPDAATVALNSLRRAAVEVTEFRCALCGAKLSIAIREEDDGDLYFVSPCHRGCMPAGRTRTVYR